MDCIFCKIANGLIPSDKVFEDDKMVVIKDLNPQSKIHLLLIPKTHYANIEEWVTADPDGMSACIRQLALISKRLGLEDGYRLVTNLGKNGRQSVPHVHIHILGGECLADKMG